jgi:hypothetical protein
MTSIRHTYSQIPANKLYINITAIQSTIVDSNNNPVGWLSAQPAQVLSTPGAAVLRDMGRNVYLPNPTTPTTVGSQSTVLRRVQLVTVGVNGYYGTGDSASSLAGSDTDFYAGYIRLGGQTYGGGNGVPTGVARLN